MFPKKVMYNLENLHELTPGSGDISLQPNQSTGKAHEPEIATDALLKA